jgi:deazaflavin-dependent oxidoreductase (nitroreductase family)
VIASFAGNAKNPEWYQNLVANPDVGVQLRARRFRARAGTVTGDERAGEWARVVARAPMYGEYQRMTKREIPIVLLRVLPPE